MNQEPDKNLERMIDERLRALPELRAPATLLPNVMQRIASQGAKVWWRCSWFEWPRGMQILSLALLAALLGAGWYFGDVFPVSTGDLTGHVTGSLSFLKPVWTLVSTLVGALHLLVGSIKTEYIVLGAAVMAALYLAAVALGSMCYRLAADRSPVS